MSRKPEKVVSVDELAKERLPEEQCAQADRVQFRVEIDSSELDVRFSISANRALLRKLLIGLGGFGAILSWISTL